MEPIHSSSSGPAYHNEDSWTCHRCGWVYPNPHPSAKHRRNHKKHCGKVKGFEVKSHAEHKGGSSDEVSSDDESHAKKESLEHDPTSVPTAIPIESGTTNIGKEKLTNPAGSLSQSEDTPLIDVDVPIVVQAEKSTTELTQSITSPPGGGQAMQETPVDKVDLPMPDEGIEVLCKQDDKLEDPSGTRTHNLIYFEGDMKTPEMEEVIPGMNTPNMGSDIKQMTSSEAREEQGFLAKATQEPDHKSKEFDWKQTQSVASMSDLSETLAMAGGVSLAEDKAEPAAHGSRGLDLVLDQAKQADKPETANPPSIHGAGLHPHDSWVCHRCGWAYPNPHPSAKHRRNHKKHCGKIKGFELGSDETHHQGGSSDEVSTDEESPSKEEHQAPQLEKQAGVEMDQPILQTHAQGEDLSVANSHEELPVSSDVEGLSTPCVNLEDFPSKQAAEALPRPSQSNLEPSSTKDVSVKEDPAAHVLKDSKEKLGVAPLEAVGIYESAISETLPDAVQTLIKSPEAEPRPLETLATRMVDDSEKEESKEVSASGTEGIGPVLLEDACFAPVPEEPVVLENPSPSTPLEGPVALEGPVVLEKVSNDPTRPPAVSDPSPPFAVEDKELMESAVPTMAAEADSFKCDVQKEEKINDGMETPAASVAPTVPAGTVQEVVEKESAVPAMGAEVDGLKCDAEREENINDGIEASAVSVAPTVPVGSVQDEVPVKEDFAAPSEVTPPEMPSETIVLGEPCNALSNQGIGWGVDGLESDAEKGENSYNGIDAAAASAAQIVPAGPVQDVVVVKKDFVAPSGVTPPEMPSETIVLGEPCNAVSYHGTGQDFAAPSEVKPPEIPSETIELGEPCNALSNQGTGQEEFSSRAVDSKGSDGKFKLVAEVAVIPAGPSNEVEANRDLGTLKSGPSTSEDEIGAIERVKESSAEGLPPPMENIGKPVVGIDDEGKRCEVKAEEASLLRKDSEAKFGSRSDSLEIYEDAQDTLETCSVGGGSVEENETSEGAQEEIKHLDQGTSLERARLTEEPPVSPDRRIFGEEEEEEEDASPPATTYVAAEAESQDLRAPSPEAWQELPGPDKVKPVAENSTTTISEVTEDGKSGESHTPLRSLMVKEAAEKKDGDSASGDRRDGDSASGDRRDGDNKKTQGASRNGTSKSNNKSRSSFWSNCICCPTVH